MSVEYSIQADVSREQLLRAIRTDCVTFLAFYLGEELTLEVPEFHIEIWDEFLSILDAVNSPDFLIGTLQKLFCVPRDHSKSTLAKLAVILFARYSKLRFYLYASNTKAIALNACKDIKSWLESPQDGELYGAKRSGWVEKSNDADGIYILHIPVPDSNVPKRIIIKAIGSDAQVRGTLIDNQRPEFCVFDDCEDNSTCSTDVTQARFDAWLMGAALKAVAKRAVIIILGNMISERQMLVRLSRLKAWNPTVFGAIVRDKQTGRLKPLWPGRHTLESLIQQYKEHRALGIGHIWAYELMNLTAETVFGTDMENVVSIPMPNPDQLLSGFITLDPAYGLEAYHDSTAITVHAHLHPDYPGAGIPHVIDSYVQRMTEEQILDKLIELSLYWGINTWCIESVMGQRLFIPLFQTLMKLRQLNPDAFVMLPVMRGNNDGAKASAIFAFRNAVSKGSYGIAENLERMFDKLIQYNPKSKDHDDELDSASFGMTIWTLHGESIQAAGIVQVAGMLYGEASNAPYISELESSPM